MPVKVLKNENDFIHKLKLGNSSKFEGDNIKIEVVRQRNPLEYTAHYFRKVGNDWRKFSHLISNCVFDIVEDCQKELKIYN